MKLIDAEKLCMYLADLQLSNAPDERDSEEVQKEMKSNYEFIGFLINLIDKQPTAYDVDAVVEQLEDMHEQKALACHMAVIQLDVNRRENQNE